MSFIELQTSIEVGLIYAIVALGMYLTFRIIDFPDLTCDGSFVTGAAICGVSLKAGYHPCIALILGACAGGISGMITGALYAYCNITNLLAGILTSFMLYSINLRIMGGVPNIALLASAAPTTAVLSICAVSVLVVLAYILITDIGLALRSIGTNKQLAIINGVALAPYTIATLGLSNALVGLGGGLFCQYQHFADLSQGLGTVIIGLAAIIIGEKLIATRSLVLNLISCILGSIIYRLIIALALNNHFLGLASSDLNLITGMLIIVVMLMPKGSRSRRLSW